MENNRMTAPAHTPGPLRIAEGVATGDASTSGFAIRDAGHDLIALVTLGDDARETAYDKAETAANAARLVACWNACDGLSNEALAVNPLADTLRRTIADNAELRAERDSLRAALELIRDSGGFNGGTWLGELQGIARDALRGAK